MVVCRVYGLFIENIADKVHAGVPLQHQIKPTVYQAVFESGYRIKKP
jgi:hypothetical protein